LIGSGPYSHFRSPLRRLAANGDSPADARTDGTEADLTRRGLRLRIARDEFLRFTLERATVITF
jgi:hypothetical protein